MPRSSDSRAVEQIKYLAVQKIAASEIHRRITIQFEGTGIIVPALRTVERICSDIRSRDHEPWSVADADQMDVRAVLDVLLAVTEGTEGRKTSLTKAEARLAVAITHGGPTLGPWHVWRLARLYINREEVEDTADIDRFLAMSPSVVTAGGCPDHEDQAWCFDLILANGWIEDLQDHWDRWPERPYPGLTMGLAPSRGDDAALKMLQMNTRWWALPESEEFNIPRGTVHDSDVGLIVMHAPLGNVPEEG